MQLETQLPDELRALIHGDLVPVLSVCVSLGFSFALAKDSDRSGGSRGFSELGIFQHAAST